MTPNFDGLEVLVKLGLVFLGILCLAAVGAVIYGITLLF